LQDRRAQFQGPVFITWFIRNFMMSFVGSSGDSVDLEKWYEVWNIVEKSEDAPKLDTIDSQLNYRKEEILKTYRTIQEMMNNAPS
jgi:hypothetical protein